MRINTLLNDDGPASSPAPKGPGRGNWSRNRTSGVGAAGAARTFKSKLDAGASQDGQSPSTSAPTFNGPHGFYLPLNGSDPSHKRTRPLTQHQLAVEQYRRRRVDVILDRGIRIEYKAAAKRRRKANPVMLSWIRCKGMPDGYDTDEETHAQQINLQDIDVGTKTPPPMPAGLVPLDFGGEVNDHGEESYFRAKMLNRALRRLERWEGGRITPRTRPKGEREARDAYAGEVRPVAEDDDDDDDEDMADVDADDALDRRDESDSDEDEEMDGRGERGWDAHTLPPLPMMH
jgi:Ino eighty subunit 1